MVRRMAVLERYAALRCLWHEAGPTSMRLAGVNPPSAGPRSVNAHDEDGENNSDGGDGEGDQNSRAAISV
eukprot:5671956-Prymnesium_polylepis.1